MGSHPMPANPQVNEAEAKKLWLGFSRRNNLAPDQQKAASAGFFSIQTKLNPLQGKA